ncbi:hypothetical protein WA1_04965 [Scytonema hofmannii PCC 7110]|uniref:Uncharacterized protein n=1 Tax=Scytonema hofmannii PCC 7110 TaxID=128403 RepID=A0A139WZJ5_9CYAN|nr:hypothetical protein [Scytonema hofmannii]KYC37858.1 hypothetical protein WA1_04965 [Scytonema hofmannii PCC 7110]
MKAELLKRLFKAIALSDREAIDKLTQLVIEEERSKGHILLADQLENITKKSQKEKPEERSQPAPLVSEPSALSELPSSKRFNLPLHKTYSKLLIASHSSSLD